MLSRTISVPTRAVERARRRWRSVLLVLLVLLAGAWGGLLAIWAYSDSAELSVGRISLSVSPFHDGALDAYVPLVDWGVRFPGVRFPARVQVQLETVDRGAARRLVTRGLPAADSVRAEVRSALAKYLRQLALLAAGGALALGGLVACAIRGGRPRLRWLVATAASTAVAWVVVVATLLAPRGDLAGPVYYAHGSDIPIALRAAQVPSRSSKQLGTEVGNQLLGLARLIIAPGNRVALTGLPRLTIASDLHNNVIAIPTIARVAGEGPLLFAGDLSDRGTPLETSAIRSMVGAAKRMVIVGGNHDSDESLRELARAGAIVLTEFGRLRSDGTYGQMVSRIAGLRIAGYTSPNVRLAATSYRDRGAEITSAAQAAFSTWLSGLQNKVDIVMVHEPELAEPAIQALRADPSTHPLLIVAGHTHQQAIRSADDLSEVNGGTAGAGGTGNLEEAQALGLAVVTYRPPTAHQRFTPLAVDLIQVVPDTGEATARRVRLDQGSVDIGDPLAPSPEPG